MSVREFLSDKIFVIAIRARQFASSAVLGAPGGHTDS